MKKVVFIGVALSFLFAILFVSTTPLASAGELPNMISFTSYKVGSLGYTITSGFREAIEKKTPMKVRVEPYDTDVARILPLKTKESEMSILTGATGTCASYGIAEFGEKEWGPQPIRQVWRGMTLYLSMLARGDAGLKYPKDMRGKKVPDVPGWPAGMLTIEGCMAFGNLGWNDVQKVPMSGYVDQLKGLLQGTVDVAYGATVTPTMKEIEAGPHGIAWILLPFDDKEGWRRLQEKAPWLTPGLCKKAPGLKEGETLELGSYPYTLWSYAHTDPDVVYAVVKSLGEGYDVYKDMHKALAAWTLKQAVTDPSPVPYHDGAIRYFKEAGVWTPEMDQWQADQLKAFEARVAAFKK
jgi:TRAP transporter TAXI family solute receptor